MRNRWKGGSANLRPQSDFQDLGDFRVFCIKKLCGKLSKKLEIYPRVNSMALTVIINPSALL